jgi:hypothetical protein
MREFTAVERWMRGVRAGSHLAAAVLAAPLAALILFGQPAAGNAQTDRTAGLFSLVRADYSGERALDIVALMDRYWREPGNEGFNASIHRVEQDLVAAGYRTEEDAAGHPFTYRIERRPMSRPAWDPLGASLTIVGEAEPLLRFDPNRNMIAAYSYSTPAGGVEAPLVYVGRGRPSDFEGLDVAGSIVFGETSVGRLFREAVQNRGALGVISYSMPAYNRPEKHQHSIQFSRIPHDPDRRSWGLRLSYAARGRLLEALDRGPVAVRVETRSRIYESEELTLVADVRGSRLPGERLVFSAHVQEPGANDNASGVAAQAEMAITLARLVERGMALPERSITFLWGLEISSTARYLTGDPDRAAGVRWGISLDMVGENTALTGGTFLIEKMPDPSAVWTRGDDHHTEWGGRPLSPDALFPHYLNDFMLNRCLEQATHAGWVVGTNPYEGGSDHVPFLREGIPGLLLWHFTDEFYHTDGDRLDKVSAVTMQNVGVSALVSALVLASADASVARGIIDETEAAAVRRLDVEYEISRRLVESGGDREGEVPILSAWVDWYAAAIGTVADLEGGEASSEIRREIDAAVARVKAHGSSLISKLGGR